MFDLLKKLFERAWWKMNRSNVRESIVYCEKLEALSDLPTDAAKAMAMRLVSRNEGVEVATCDSDWNVSELPFPPPKDLQVFFDIHSAITIDSDYRACRDEAHVFDGDPEVLVIGQDPQIELLGIRSGSGGELESYSFEEGEWEVSYRSIYHWIVMTHFAARA